jgi:hypothetical protein
VLYAIPLIALAALGVTLAVLSTPPPAKQAALSYTFQILFQKENSTGGGVQGVIPDHAIGETGGYWNASFSLNRYGINTGHAPLYMDSPATACSQVVCTINVKSTVAYNYTLGDFFQVWGIPLSENDTWNLQRSGNYAWMLCIGPDPSSAVRVINDWPGLVLAPSLQLTLEYVDYSSPYGCAPT